MARKKKLQSGQRSTPAEAEQAKHRQRERFERWRQRAARARRIRRDWERDYDVTKAENYFLGNQSSPGRRGKDTIFNHYRATLKTIKPNLFHQAPKFFVRPGQGLKAGAEERAAATGEAVLESIGNQDQNLKRAGNLALLQAFFRVGCLKQVFDPHMLPNPQAGQPIYEEDDDGNPFLDEMERPRVKHNPMTNTPMLEPDEILTDEVYHYAWVDAKTLLLPDEGPDRSKWTWIGEEITVTLEEAKADTRFPEARRAQFTANAKLRDLDEPSRKRLPLEQTTDEDQPFTYVEVYSRNEQRRLIWADGQTVDEFLVDELLPDGIEDHPYALLFLGDPILGPEPCPWPAPETRSWIPVQDDYNIHRKQITNGAKRAARKGCYEEGTFPNADEALKVLASPDDMAFAKVTSLKKIPQFMQEPPLSNDIYKAVELDLIDWRIITGQPGARLSSPEADTATEATFVEKAANLRDVDKQDAVTDWLAEAGRKMLQLVKGTLTLDLWIKIRGWSDVELGKYVERTYGIPPDMLTALQRQVPGLKDLIKARVGPERWRRVTHEDLSFEADVSVVPGSARPRNLESERRVLLQLIPAFAQNPAILKVPGLVKRILRAFDMDDDQLLAELQAMADVMISVAANQAGRNQGGNANGGGASSPTAGNPDIAALLQGVQGTLT